jgi:anti-sigma regulatory factor (Ser/Thr protein kinase)
MRQLNADVQLPDGAAAASAARTALRSLLDGWQLTDSDWVYDATLVVSELVSNAIRHGSGQVCLHVHVDGRRIRLAVSDTSTRSPQQRTGDQRTIGGRGLAVIDAVAADWGSDVHDDGKQVWASLEPYPGALA